MADVVLQSGLFGIQSHLDRPSQVKIGLRLVLAVLPAVLLTVATIRHPQALLLGATVFQWICLAIAFRNQSWRQQAGSLVFVMYLAGFACLGAAASLFFHDWYLNQAEGAVLLIALGLFLVQLHRESGAVEMRRARRLAQRLAGRNNWPADLDACRTVPEVQQLRDALRGDPAPALALLNHPRPQVRMAALAALESRECWLQAQAEVVLEAASLAQEPPVRAAALCALANVEERSLVEKLTEFLHDPAAEVRRAAAEALLRDTERRWPWIRLAIRNLLANTSLQQEGPLLPRGELLAAEAVKDLTAWAAQKGILAHRAIMTLKMHYQRLLNELPDESLIEDLQRQLADPHAPPALRTELAQMLHQQNLLDQQLHEKLLDPLNPAPLRLVAADALLAKGQHDGAVFALRDIARLPNREIALATADVVQRRLGVDLGLAMGQPLPAVHTRRAAEVTRRVMVWATGRDIRGKTVK